MIVYQISQFDYEMANFDPYEILEVSKFEAMQTRGSREGFCHEYEMCRTHLL